MPTEFLKHAPSGLQVYYWLGLGAALALTATVYKWVWRALGYFWSHTFGPPSVRDYPVWRAPEASPGHPPEVDRVGGEGRG